MIESQGFAIMPSVVPLGVIDELIAALGNSAHAVRNLIETVPLVGALARCPEVRNLARAVLGPDAFVARSLLFDKTPGANWRVAWHQDLTIAVRERHEVVGFAPWSEKAGIPHVQPPSAVLERMLTLRIHLDPCGPDNGPLRVLPGSHRGGKLGADDIIEWRGRVAEFHCLADRGAVVMMKPLLLHASSSAVSPGHRRTIHLEFAAEDLPGGLEWHGRW